MVLKKGQQMAIRANKVGKVPQALLDAAIKASDDYDDDRNRDTIGTYTEERYARVVYTVLKMVRTNPELLG